MLVPNRDLEPLEPLLELLMHVVKSDADDVIRIRQHLVGTPPQSGPLHGVQSSRSSYEEQSLEGDVAVPERFREAVCLFVIVEVEKPVRELAQSVFRPPTPFRARAPRLIDEDAVYAMTLLICTLMQEAAPSRCVFRFVPMQPREVVERRLVN